MKIRRFLHIILASAVLFLAWQIFQTWRQDVPAPSAGHSNEKVRVAATVTLPGRSLRTGKEIANNISAQDLFAPSRRSQPQDSQGAQKEVIPPPTHLTLVGVMLVPGREVAFLSDSSNDNKVTRVRKWELIEQYRLARVNRSAVTLALGEGGKEVDLPLKLLDSQSARKVPRLVSAPTSQQVVAPKTEMSPEVRQDIEKMQSRLRDLRRQAVRAQNKGPTLP